MNLNNPFRELELYNSYLLKELIVLCYDTFVFFCLKFPLILTYCCDPRLYSRWAL